MLTGTIKDLRKPEETFKVKKVELSTLRLPDVSDFNIPCEYLLKTEEARHSLLFHSNDEPLLVNETVITSGDNTAFAALDQNWKQLLPLG